MEEMTIQEKARRYDEAIKRVENIKTGKCETTFIFSEGLFEYIFPELKESVIHWIRKELEDKYVTDNIVNNVMADKALAWLKMQGEQKPTDNEMKELLRTEYEKERADALAEVYCQKPERNPNLKEETLTKLIEEIDRLDEERKQNTKYKSAKSGFAHTVRYFFLSNEINTLGELLSLGRKHVARCRNIGKMTMWAIDKALENLYGITEW